MTVNDYGDKGDDYGNANERMKKMHLFSVYCLAKHVLLLGRMEMELICPLHLFSNCCHNSQCGLYSYPLDNTSLNRMEIGCYALLATAVFSYHG